MSTAPVGCGQCSPMRPLGVGHEKSGVRAPPIRRGPRARSPGFPSREGLRACVLLGGALRAGILGQPGGGVGPTSMGGALAMR